VEAFFIKHGAGTRASAKKFPEGGAANGKKIENSKKIPKNSTIKPLPWRANGKRDRKIAKKNRK